MKMIEFRLFCVAACFLPLAICHSAVPADSKAAGELAWKFEYDEGDRLIKAVDPAGRATQLQYSFYDSKRLHKLVRTCDDGSSVTREFDESGRLTRMTDGAGLVSYGYDDLGRLNRVARQGTHAIDYTYDTLDHITSLQVADFYQIDYSYDFLGRLASMKTPAGLVTYEYQTGLGQVVRSLPNGVKTFWKRQPNGELEEITHGFFKKPQDKQYAVLAQYTYQHGPDSRITAIRERSPQGEFAKRYGYDNMGRLVNATGSGGQTYGYAYDLVGNRVKATATGRPDRIYAYDWAGRLTSVDGKPCTYDASGNLTDLTLDGVDRHYRYNPDGCLAEVQAGGENLRYGYDGFDRQISAKVAAGETRFTPDPMSRCWQPLVLEDPTGNRTLVIWDGLTPLAIVRGGQVEWMLGDHTGSVRLVTDANGAVKRRGQYDPFGIQVEVGGSDSQYASFVGLPWNREAAGYQTLARIYLPQLGQFLQPDPQKRFPSTDSETCSLYSYCGADPVNFVDLNGTERTPAEMRDRQREVMDRIREQQDEMRMRQQEMMDRIRQQQTEMRIGQQEMMDRLRRQQTEMRTRMEMQGDVGLRQLRGYEAFRDGFLYIWPRTLVAEGLNVYGNIASVIGGLPGVFVGAVAKGVRDNLTSDIGHIGRDVQSKLRSQAEGTDNLVEMIEKVQLVKELLKSGSVAFYEKIERKDYNRATLQGRDFNIDTKYPSDYLGETPLTPRLGQPNRDVIANIYIKPYSEYRLAVGQALKSVFEDRRDEFVEEVTKAVVKGELRFSTPTGGGSRALLTPSTVGGVYLGGAGQALEGIGLLDGVAIEANGKLVLLGKTGSKIKLPPLRVDDLVTVFRSVYLHGDGPTVTIDPHPQNPRGPVMIISHSEATDGTYVGWVLYQADRLMKGYNLGKDNLTKAEMRSGVPHYEEVLETIYFGGREAGNLDQRSNWERFWIVPAEARRFATTPTELTLFDVPLKVRTQPMKWENGSLVDDLTRSPSPGAAAFTNWFTTSYDAIAGEQFLTPPSESGITQPVPVFSELRRIALLTAIAEKLRDQKVPMPFWMRDYEVRPVPFEKTTPSLTNSRSKGRMETSIYGGVNLSVADPDVRNFNQASDLSKLPAEQQAAGRETLTRSGPLAEVVRKEMVAAEPLQAKAFTHQGVAYQALALPGADTRALGPCRLEEADLVVPFAGGRDIRLVRNLNSFFNPKGPWGRGWTMDLPKLQEIRIPVSREGNNVSYTIGYDLFTPLNSLNARFKEVRPVKELGGSRLQVPDAEAPFHGLADDRPNFLKDVETHVLYLKNGQEWYFTKYSDFIAVKDGPQVTVYERGTDGQVTRIVGFLDGVLAAQIDLDYTAQGALTNAVGRSFDNPKQKLLEVSYAYDSSGRLAGVTSTDGTVGYGYRDSWVYSVTWTAKTADSKPEALNTFGYNERGQVLSEQRGQRTLRHVIAAIPGGVETSVAQASDGGARDFVRYDTQMRPVEAKEADGTHTAWTYKSDGSVVTTLTMPDKRKVTVSESADGRRRSVNAVGSPSLVAQFDVGGNLASLAENQRVLLTQQWRPDGQLDKVVTEMQGISCQYSEHGLLSSIRVHPPKAGEKLSEWQETKLDRRGTPVEVKDYTGLHLQFEYNATGALVAAVQRTPEGNLGYNVNRDSEGRVQAIKSSWDNSTYDYTTNGSLRRIELTRDKQSAAVELAGGLVRKVITFDGGVTTFDYHDQGSLAGAPKGVRCANGLKLAHEYDTEGRLKVVSVGSDRRVRLGYDAKGRVVMYAWEALAGSAQ